MNRRLNPELFNSPSDSFEAPSSNSSAVATRKLEKELRETRKQVSHLESMMEVLQSQMISVNETGEKRTQELHRLSLPGQCHGDLGLKLEHGKVLLAQLQQAILHHQIEEISDASRNCPCCGRARPIHDYRTRVLDTLFGRFSLTCRLRSK